MNMMNFIYFFIYLLLTEWSIVIAFQTIKQKKENRIFTDGSMRRAHLEKVESSEEKGIRVGILGFGTIASAIATGLLTQNEIPIQYISITKRSERKSKSFKSQFPDKVRLITERGPPGLQQIVEDSDLVLLCVLPQQVDDILKEITLDSTRHTLISLVSTTDLQTLTKLSGLHEDRVFKMICLPRVAKLQGICLLTPKANNQLISSICRSLGGLIECSTEDEMRTMMVMTGLMGPMYAIARANKEWLLTKGISSENSNAFISQTYLSVIQDMAEECHNPERFDQLVAEQTPGGLNEQAIRNLESLGVFSAYAATMEAMLQRLEGKSDGNLTQK